MMKNYLERLLIDLGFGKSEHRFYSKEGDDFFRVDEYKESELLDYFKTEVTKDAIDDYEKLIKFDDEAKVNSAQIVLVKVTDLQTFFTKHKNQLMKIEEDPYYFRKYILVYTDDAMNGISEYSLSELEEFVLNDKNYELFEADMYSVPIFFLGMECYVKLPFLTLPIRDENYASLNHLIEKEIDKNDKQLSEKNALKISEFVCSEENESSIALEHLINLETETEIIKQLKELYKTP